MEAERTKTFWKTEPLLGGIALLLLMVGCFFVLRPFMTALMWAMILAYTLSPMQRMFTRWFRGSRTLAACLVTLTLTIIFAGPVVLIGLSIAQDGKDLALATRNWFMGVPAEPPTWVSRVPVVGEELKGYWQGFAEDRERWMDELDKEVATAPRPKIVLETEVGQIVQDLAPAPSPPAVQAPPSPTLPTIASGVSDAANDSPHLVIFLGKFLSWAQSWLIEAGKLVVHGVAEVLISVFLAFFLLKDSSNLADRLMVAVERLAGDRGRHLLKVAGDTVRGVIYGILGTALVQALVAGLGFWIAEVPGVVLLSVLTFFFAVIPFGPPLLWIPASLWLFAQHKPGLGVFLLLWGFLGISSVDNFLRPYLISQGNKMPFALIFCGVIGGALAFGLVGVFIGPTLLAVVFRLVEEWSQNQPSPDESSGTPGISELHENLESATPSHGG
ncbi:MAG: AI-2E family transporter [Gloeobacteraceae cyanobacterium ES-bin-144]|nr:AI-2E family transporter [Verrucomicrobiales bacterium]